MFVLKKKQLVVVACLLMLSMVSVLGGGRAETAAPDTSVVKYAIGTPGIESNLFWRTPGNFPMPHQQFMVGQNELTGAYDESGLAKSWEHNEDMTEWTFYLHENAEWHYGWGPVTADDVVHSLELGTGSDARLSGLERISHARAEAIDDHTVKFYLGRPEAEFLFAHGLRGALQIFSKAQYDAEGLDGYRRQPAGTGHFRLASYREGQGATFEKVENHWSGKDAMIDKLELVFVDESATRLALIAAGDVDMTTLPLELQSQAESLGLGVIPSKLLGMQTAWMYWGAYIDPPHDDLPWLDRRIREAGARAVNTNDMLNIVYDGRAERIVKYGMHEPHEGWNQDLVDRFDDMYGYDPDRARELLKEAGYPENFSNPVIPIISTELAGNPEFPTLAEYIQSAFEAVGLRAEIREMAYARHNEIRATLSTDYTLPLRNLPIRPTEPFFSTFYSEDGSPAHTYSSDEFESLYRKYITTFGAEERDEMAAELFKIAYEDYATIPLAGLTIDVVYNPKVVQDWTFPGASSIGVSHWHLIEPAK